MFIDILKDCINDTISMLPLLFITYCFIEVLERRQSDDDRLFFALQKAGPLVGALVGLIPQCGFSVLAAMLFIQRNISLGTLIAVMVATSDEAIPILISNPDLYNVLIFVLVFKFIVGVIAGYAVDSIFERKQKIILFEDMEEEEYDEQEQESGGQCSCCYPQYPIPLSALIRSLKIYGFLFVTSFVLTFLIEFAGQDFLRTVLLNNSVFQPVLATLIGFIPNCAATVILAELFASGSLSLGSLFAGLVSNSGLAMLMLIRYEENRKKLGKVILILSIVAIFSGILIQFLI